MKGPYRTAKKVEDIRGYSKSKSKGNPNGEGIHGERSTTEGDFVSRRQERESQEQPSYMEKGTNRYKLMSTAE
jgi:hypothetical protein